MTRRLLIGALTTAAAFSLLSSMTLEADLPSAAQITALAAIAAPLIAMVTCTTAVGLRLTVKATRTCWGLLTRLRHPK